MTTQGILTLTLCLLSGPADTPRKRPAVPKVSYLEVARQEIVHGHLKKAIRALAAARRCWRKHRTACGFDRVDYQSLVGLIYLEHGKYRKAAKAFLEVVRKKPQRKAAWLYLGQALYELKKDKAAVVALQRAESVGREMPRYYAMLARAAHRSHQHEVARKTLGKGLRRFPRHRVLHLELTLLYTRHGLLRAGLDVARHYLRVTKGDRLAHLLVADAFIEARRYGRAIRVLEEARLADPRDRRVLERLAYTYARQGHAYASARLFVRLARQDPTYAHAAAEQLRAAGRRREALRWNHRVPNDKRRLQQRLNLLLASGSFHRALLLETPLRRHDIMGPEVRYRLAHAAIRAGRYAASERLLRGLRGKRWKTRRTRLSEVVKICKEKPWLCP